MHKVDTNRKKYSKAESAGYKACNNYESSSRDSVIIPVGVPSSLTAIPEMEARNAFGMN